MDIRQKYIAFTLLFCTCEYSHNQYNNKIYTAHSFPKYITSQHDPEPRAIQCMLLSHIKTCAATVWMLPIIKNVRLTLILLMWRIGWAPNSIPIYIQQDGTLHSLFTPGNCSTCFGWYFHPSSEAHTTVSTAPGICYTVTATCHYRGRVGTGLSVLWVAYATHSTLKPVPTLPR
jgi:hypothetical protein